MYGRSEKPASKKRKKLLKERKKGYSVGEWEEEGNI